MKQLSYDTKNITNGSKTDVQNLSFVIGKTYDNTFQRQWSYPLKPIKNDKFDQLDTFTKTMKFYYLT